YCHFYLVNCFGPVPVIIATAKETTAYAPRNTVTEVYTQIKADLMDAMNTLPGDYAISGTKRIRANKWPAAALLGRVYLYNKEWANAEAMVTTVLANTSLYGLQTLALAFKRYQKESILELERNALNTYEATSIFLYYTANQNPMLTGLLNSFETGDL